MVLKIPDSINILFGPKVLKIEFIANCKKITWFNIKIGISCFPLGKKYVMLWIYMTESEQEMPSGSTLQFYFIYLFIIFLRFCF